MTVCVCEDRKLFLKDEKKTIVAECIVAFSHTFHYDIEAKEDTLYLKE